MPDDMKTESRPSPDYPGFITIGKDPGGAIESQRLFALQHERDSLTWELAENEPFYKALGLVHHDIVNRGEKPQKLEDILAHIPNLTKELTGRDVSSEEIQRLGLDRIAEVFFSIAQTMPPLYLDFSRALVEKAGSGGDTSDPNLVFLFSGRDSFPFLLGFNEYQRRNGLSQRKLYAPFNRVGFQKFFGKPENEKEYLDDLKEYFRINNLQDSRMFVIDFGFIGSLERINQIILPEGTRPRELNHFLFTSFRKKGKPPWFLDRLRFMGYNVTRDQEQSGERLSGYLNSLVEKAQDPTLTRIMTGGMDPSIDWKPYLNPFTLFFQEIGSGVNETRQDNISQGDSRAFKGTHYKFASVQQIVGIYAYLEGLHYALPRYSGGISEEQSIGSLKGLFELFERFPDFFQELIPQEDRRHIEKPPMSTHFKHATERMDELNTIPISTVKFPKEIME